MRWVVLAVALVVLVALLAKEIVLAKKRVADLKAQLRQEEAAIEEVLNTGKAVGAAGLTVRKAAAVIVKEAKDAAEKTLVAPRAKAAQAKEAAERAEKAAAITARVLDTAKEKLKAATDPKEVADWKNVVAELETAATEKKTGTEKARADAKADATELQKVTERALTTVKRATDVADENGRAAQADEAQANRNIAEAVEKRDRTEAKLRKAELHLEALTK